MNLAIEIYMQTGRTPSRWITSRLLEPTSDNSTLHPGLQLGLVWVLVLLVASVVKKE